MLDITALLGSAQSPDASTRNAAEAQLASLQETQYPSFLLSLAAELSSAEKPVDARRLAGLVLKNALDAKDAARQVGDCDRPCLPVRGAACGSRGGSDHHAAPPAPTAGGAVPALDESGCGGAGADQAAHAGDPGGAGMGRERGKGTGVAGVIGFERRFERGAGKMWIGGSFSAVFLK